MEEIGFRIVSKYVLDYLESDGSRTKDIVIIGRKES